MSVLHACMSVSNSFVTKQMVTTINLIVWI
jgi:hypothetical protein